MGLMSIEFRRFERHRWGVVLVAAVSFFIGSGITSLAWAGWQSIWGQEPPNEVGLVDFAPVQVPPTLAAGIVKLGAYTPVIGVSAGGHYRAYVTAALMRPESHVVNDMLGGVPISVTYCSDLDCTRVFTEPGGTEPLDLRVGGYYGRRVNGHEEGSMLLRLGEVYYRQDNGEPVHGDRHVPFPFVAVEFIRGSWHDWRKAHPDTDVFVGSLNVSTEETPPSVPYSSQPPGAPGTPQGD
jgi:hypothetical protein